MTMRYKAVFFDLDGTLRIPTPGPTAAFIHFARSLDIDISPTAEKRVKLWAHHYWGQNELVKQDMEQFGRDSFWVNYSKLLLEAVDVSSDLMQRARLVREWFETGYTPQVELASGAIDLLTGLKQAGIILGLVSNRTDPLQEAVAELGLEEFFDMTLAAGEIGCWKPNPAIFHHALSQFTGLRPECCLYIGDNYYADGLGAERAGMMPVLFDPDDLYSQSTFKRINCMSDLRPLVG
ncbi:MAG: HAD family hydrolase [Chloroflexi bacterium]|nr:HAD family hydrolase [Chloroflexota bacterium]